MPLFWLSCAFLSGILIGSWISVNGLVWLGLSALFLAFQVLLWKGYFPKLKSKLLQFVYTFLSPTFLELSIKVPMTMLGVAFFIGAARFQAIQSPSAADQLLFYNDYPDEWYVRGVIVAPPIEKDNKTQLVVEVKEISSLSANPAANMKVKGKLLLKTDSLATFMYGDEIEFNSKLSSPKEGDGFSYKVFLAARGINTLALSHLVKMVSRNQGSWLLVALFRFRQVCLDYIIKNYPAPQSFLLSGILLGEEENIPPRLAKAFQDTGTAHIIAISGFNMTLISGLFAVVFGRLLGSKRGVAAALTGVALYVLMLGANAAVLRAAIMSSLSLIARQFGRAQHGLNALLFSAAVMCIPNPLLLWDVSFQLSFGATLGLILYAEPFQQIFTSLISRWIPKSWINRISSWVSEYFLMTIAAQLTTLPIVLSHFERLSISSIYVNPLILPAQPMVMVLGGASVLAGMVFQPIGQFIAWATLPFLTYTIKVVEWFAQNQPAMITIPPLPLYASVLYAAALLLLTMYGKRLFGERMRRTVLTVTLCLLVAANVIIWQKFFTSADGQLRLTVLDVEDGDALLLQTPKGQRILLNGGERASVLADALGSRVPFVQRSLDVVIIASNKVDSIKALERVVAWYPPRKVGWAGFPSESPSARAIRLAAQEAGAELFTMERGDRLVMDDEVELQLLAQSNKGSVFLLKWRKLKVYLFDSLDESLLSTLNKNNTQPISAIWLGKNASRSKLPLAWFTRLQPFSVLVSAPSEQSINLLEHSNRAIVLDTQRYGWIQLTTNGEEMWVESQKTYGE